MWLYLLIGLDDNQSRTSWAHLKCSIRFRFMLVIKLHKPLFIRHPSKQSTRVDNFGRSKWPKIPRIQELLFAGRRLLFPFGSILLQCDYGFFSNPRLWHYHMTTISWRSNNAFNLCYCCYHPSNHNRVKMYVHSIYWFLISK